MGTAMGPLYNPIGMIPGTLLDICATQLGGGEKKGDMTGRVLESALKGRNWRGSTVTLAGTGIGRGLGKH